MHLIDQCHLGHADVAEELAELRKREKEQGIQSNWELTPSWQPVP